MWCDAFSRALYLALFLSSQLPPPPPFPSQTHCLWDWLDVYRTSRVFFCSQWLDRENMKTFAFCSLRQQTCTACGSRACDRGEHGAQTGPCLGVVVDWAGSVGGGLSSWHTVDPLVPVVSVSDALCLPVCDALGGWLSLSLMLSLNGCCLPLSCVVNILSNASLPWCSSLWPWN